MHKLWFVFVSGRCPTLTSSTPVGSRAGSRPHVEVAGALDLFTATQQQLGLKIDPARLKVEVLVVDGVEKPSAN
jgi:uncharacterized protein (TIGR03435 family)